MANNLHHPFIFYCYIFDAIKEFEAQIQRWCKEAGSDVTYEFLQVSFLALATKAEVEREFRRLQISVHLIQFLLYP